MEKVESGSAFQCLRNVSLKLKLLGLYFSGLALLGCIGYGFFIYLEVKNYNLDRAVLHTQASYFEKMAFAHLQYSVNLHNHLTKVYHESDSAHEKNAKTTIINDFLNSVVVLSDENFNFAIFDYLGKLVTTNSKALQHLMQDNSVDHGAINRIIQKTSSGIHSDYIELKDAEGSAKTTGFYVNVILFEPLSYYVMAIAKNEHAEASIGQVMQKKKREIINSVIFSLLLGLGGSSIVLTILFLYLRLLTGNIGEITKSISQLSSGEKTDVSLEPKTDDEVGRMIAAFNGYVQKKINLERFKQLIEEDEGISDVYGRIFTILESFAIDNFALYEVNNSKNHMKHISPESEGLEEASGFTMPCNREILLNADACRAKRLAQVVAGESDYRVCPRFLGYNQGYRHLCIPIIISGTAGEIVHITIKPGEEENLRKKTPVMLEYFRNAAPVIESKKLLASLKEATLRDNLTGLNNRRFLEEYVEILISEAEREKKKIGILMADLDFFKKVNDVHGHLVGDRVLKILAKIMQNSVRSSDIVVRYGGEEFLLIIKKANDDKDVMAVAEKIRKNVEEHVMKIDSGITLKKTLTIGVALFPKDSENFWQAVKFADVALYRGKEAGRNRVVRFEASMWDIEEEY
ncbi:MAG: sensor domain-containing diguanylate cyclase [Deltaproteobacteria bacterium]|nr:sensor domain-containing diguanylate cyclase [Deltaproteobacteria bacterium]